MFLRSQPTRRAATVAAAALLAALLAVIVAGIAGCARSAGHRPHRSASPAPSVNLAIDPALVGDRSHSVSCTRPVDRASRLAWHQVEDLRLETGLPLAPGAWVEAVNHASQWTLTITTPRGRRTEHRVRQGTAPLAFDGSCLRPVYRLHKPVTVYRAGQVLVLNARELVVVDAGTWDGQVMWTAENGRDGRRYGVFPNALDATGTESYAVPIGWWRDDPRALFCRLRRPLPIHGGKTLHPRTAIAITATVSCGSAPDDDVVGVTRFHKGRLGGYVETTRGALRASLSQNAWKPSVRARIDGSRESRCPGR